MAEERVVLTAELKDEASAPLGALSTRVDGANKRVRQSTSQNADAVAAAGRRISSSTEGVGRDMGAMATAAERAAGRTAGAVDEAASRIRTYGPRLGAAGRSAGEAAASGVSSGLSSGLKKAGALVATYFGAQMLGGLVKEAGIASDATDKFKATMSFAGLDTSAIETAKNAAKEYADQTVYDLPTIQRMTAQLASNGVKDYIGLTKAAGNLNAVAGGNAETFKSVAMTMTQTAGAGKLTTENWNQLSDAIPGAAGPLMAALQKAGAYTGNFRDAMEKGQISSDEFNAALMELGTQPVAVEAAKSTKTFEGAIGNLNATINSGLMRALDKIKPGATAAITALSTGLGKAIDWTAEAAQGLYDLIVKGDFTGALSRAFHIEEDNPAVGVILGIRDAVIGVTSGLTMGKDTRDQFSGQLEGWVKVGATARDILEKIAKFIWDNKEPIAVVAGLIASLFIPHWVALGTTALAEAGRNRIAWVMTQLDATKAALTHSGAVMAMIGGWISLGAQATWNAVKIAAAWVVSLGPVGWIIGLIALLVAAFVWAYNNVDWFRDGVDAAMRWIGDVVKAAVDWIVGAWQGVVDWWNGTLAPALDAVGKWFGDMLSGLGRLLTDFVGMFVDGWGMLVDFWNGILLPAIQAVGDFFAPILDWIQRLVWNASTIIVALFYKVVDFWNGVLLPALQTLGQWFSDTLTWLYNTIIQPIVDLVVGAFRGISDFWNFTLVPALQALGNWFMSILTWIYTTIIRPTVDLVVGAFNGIVDFWNLVLVPGLQAVGNWFMSILTWIYTNAVQPVIDLLVGAFNGIVDFWNGVLKPALDTVGNWFSEIIGGAISGVKDWIDKLVEGFRGFMSFLSDKLSPIVDGIRGTFEDLGRIIGDVLGKIGEFANNPLGGIQDWLGIKKDGNGQGVMPGASGGAVFAGGGVIPGYAPGRDTVPALLSRGESVLVPELTRAIGPANIMALNRKYSGGRPAGAGPSPAALSSASAAVSGGGDTYHVSVVVQGDGDPEEIKRAVKEALAEIEAERNRRVYA